MIMNIFKISVLSYETMQLDTLLRYITIPQHVPIKTVSIVYLNDSKFEVYIIFDNMNYIILTHE
ncbi:hypothetical protein [Pseudomonas phage vB_Pa-PAC2]